MKAIDKIVFAPEHAMGSMMVKQPLPSRQVDYLDPFVLLHHGKNEIPEDFEYRHEGVGPHPHRGFAPVTFVFEGAVHHQDSRGNSGTVSRGGVQWMNAGMGIIHSERPAKGGLQEIIQMWVNSPAKNKKDQPTYYPVTENDMGRYVSKDGLAEVNVVSGELFGQKGPVPTLSPINSAMITGKKGGKLKFEMQVGHNAFLYLLDGKVRIDDQVITRYNMIVFSREQMTVEVEILEDTKALFMSGEPIGEPIITQGPFVVNKEVEIMEAYRDFRMGKMGVLIEE
ncbi:hypothetical protein DYBT9275_02192 [Dyadobacter sp. CECT 9275]|uniref:Pirin family protein n=1 Tax=Dyadobacter helix TaxID=2822344 RepID=A0A916N5P6_9BACT|nr:pirin family protein [Dyadobacter sp. CECT 9275]CAG4999275.1 hypothetical protein DYBT9275_02192 [Dyadobacter sp. CECT 9275]